MSLQKLFSLQGYTAIVTGGGNGIGKAICLAFADSGAQVVCADLRLEDAEKVASACEQLGPAAMAVACDVTQDVRLQNLVTRAVNRFGSITTLVNNAGGGGPKPFDMPMDEMRRAFELNVFSGFRLSQLCVPHMKKSGVGAIINISSMAGENTNKRMVSYAASKAALNHMTRNMAFDLGPDKIRVNAIAPGAIRTAALESVLTPEIEKKMLAHTPLGRLGEGVDIAATAVFFASSASAWISGQVLTVSGGGVQELD